MMSDQSDYIYVNYHTFSLDSTNDLVEKVRYAITFHKNEIIIGGHLMFSMSLDGESLKYNVQCHSEMELHERLMEIEDLLEYNLPNIKYINAPVTERMIGFEGFVNCRN